MVVISQSTLKLFCDGVRSNSLEKVQKFVEKGLDPNYVDQETGGLSCIFCFDFSGKFVGCP